LRLFESKATNQRHCISSEPSHFETRIPAIKNLKAPKCTLENLPSLFDTHKNI
jgi:hypothetical protein